jgi:hypothetical protein
MNHLLEKFISSYSYHLLPFTSSCSDRHVSGSRYKSCVYIFAIDSRSKFGKLQLIITRSKLSRDYLKLWLWCCTCLGRHGSVRAGPEPWAEKDWRPPLKLCTLACPLYHEPRSGSDSVPLIPGCTLFRSVRLTNSSCYYNPCSVAKPSILSLVAIDFTIIHSLKLSTTSSQFRSRCI